MMCESCSLAPCACSYIASLAPGGSFEALAPVAIQMMGASRPHRGRSETSCPCPECWSLRARTWEVIA